MIPISKPQLGTKEKNSVMKVLNSGHLVEGDVTHSLEREFSKITRAGYAVAVNSGTAALHTSLYALGIGPGDEVITSPFTFIATANAIVMVGAKPVFADITPGTFTINPTEVTKKITKRTKAVIAVDLYGQPADYNGILSLTKRNKLYLIEDAAQSVGAIYGGKPVGSFADITCFSLYATKNIISGEGGMITTNSRVLADRMRKFKNHGQLPGKRYAYTGLGYNYRMTDIAAAICREQLRKLAAINSTRNRIAAQYDNALKDIPGITVPFRGENRTHVFHQYTVRIARPFPYTRDEVRERLKSKGIQTEVYYPAPLYIYPHLGSDRMQFGFRETETAVKQVLSLPVHPQLSSADIRYIIRTIVSL